MLQRLKFSLWLVNNGIPRGESVLLDFHKREDHQSLLEKIIDKEGLVYKETSTLINRTVCILGSVILGPYITITLLLRILRIQELHSLSFERFEFFYKLRDKIKIVEYQHGLSNIVKYNDKVVHGFYPTVRIVDHPTYQQIAGRYSFDVSYREYLDEFTIGSSFDYHRSFETFLHFIWIEGGFDFGTRIDVFTKKCTFIIRRPGTRSKESFDWDDLNILDREKYCVVGFFSTGLTRAAKMGFHSFRLRDESNRYNQSIPTILDI